MTIYKITNRLNGKLYVGQTCQPIEKRFLQHAHAKTPLGDAMRHCGLENFTIEVIEECAYYQQLRAREIFWIRALKSKVPNGYNQSDGGESCCKKIYHSKVAIGQSLKRFRKNFNLTQTNIADKLGIMQQTYYKYESDKATPSADFVLKLADAYGVSTDYLLGRSDEPHTYDEQEVKEAFAIRDAWRQLQNILPAPLATAPKAVGA